jgi:5-methylcytosine-specific restriction endonuclease McrA
MSLLEKDCCLKLNAAWQVLEAINPREAIEGLCRPKLPHYEKGMKRPFAALDIDYELNEDGSINKDTITIQAVEWADWINLPIRERDQVIRSARREIRVPTLVIANNYKKVPVREPRFSKHGVWVRDEFICQITKKKLTKKTGNIEHLVARSQGGETSYTNCYAVLQSINQMKADMTPEEFERKTGYKLPRKEDLKAPKFIRKIENRHGIKDWEIFLE